jgi:DsbC/DsbD-like thiol-disulfide interchange protein
MCGPMIIFLSSLLAFPGLQGQPQPVQAQLIPEVLSVQPGKPFCVAVRLQMEDGWHTYWKNPGDSGLATTIQWKLPPGFSAGKIQWPYPESLLLGLDVNYGYDKEVWLLTEITPPSNLKTGVGVALTATVKWLACLEECLPGRADILVKLLVRKEEPEADSLWSEKFQEARKKIPANSSAWNVSASAEGDIIRLFLNPAAEIKSELTDVNFFPEQSELIDYIEPQILKRTDTGYVLELKKSKFFKKWPARIQGVLYSSKGWGEAHGKPAVRIDLKLARPKSQSKELSI